MSGEPAKTGSLSRREFLTGICGASVLVALGGSVRAFAGDGADLLRPPGGQDAARFRALCVKCDRCRSVCPLGCVETASVSDGFAEARTPKLNFHRGYCDFCGKCIDACPTGALGALGAFDPAVDRIGVAVIDAGKCIAHTRGQCVVCKGSCDYGALVFSDAGLPSVDAALCNGCGRCVAACNVNVNRTYDGTSVRAIEVVPQAEVAR